jgi:metal-responsive CopG/Arc/MetJ family transcriptional regulator
MAYVKEGRHLFSLSVPHSLMDRLSERAHSERTSRSAIILELLKRELLVPDREPLTVKWEGES